MQQSMRIRIIIQKQEIHSNCPISFNSNNLMETITFLILSLKIILEIIDNTNSIIFPTKIKIQGDLN